MTIQQIAGPEEIAVVGQEEARLRVLAKLDRVFAANSYRKILLVKPLEVGEDSLDIPIARKRRYHVYPPYNLGLLRTHLTARGYEVELVDLHFEVFAFIQARKGDGLSADDITAAWQDKFTTAIKTFEPDLVGITCTFTMGHRMMIKVAELTKRTNAGIPVVAGGVHVTNAPDIVLKEGESIDFVSLYESDVSFCALIDFANGGNRDDELGQIGTIVDGQYLGLDDRTPPAPEQISIKPSYGDLPIGIYDQLGEIGAYRYWRPEGSRSAPVLSNRGCRAKCSFCSVANFNGPGVRGRTVESVIDEIEELKGEYGINHITWLDDDLFFDVKRTLKLFNEIARRDLDITWDASNGVIGSAAVAHDELIYAAVESGCIGMHFGIESGNDQILRRISKPSGVKHFLKLGELMKKFPSVFARGFLIIGFPNETLGQIKDTINLSLEMDLDWYTAQLLTPLPSTKIYDEMVDLGMIEPKSLNLEGEGFTMFSVRESERQRRKERQGRDRSDAFHNYLSDNMDHVPTREELSSLWMVVDYEINYGKIHKQKHPIKLQKMQNFLTDVSDRLTVENPISNLYLGIVEHKLGNLTAAQSRLQLSEQYLGKSEYWQQRFKVLGLNPLNAQYGPTRT